MATLATLTMSDLNEDRQTIYPLFKRKQKAVVSNGDIEDHTFTNAESKPPHSVHAQSISPAPIANGIRSISPSSKQSQSPLFTSTSEAASNHTSPLEIDPNDGRRKRRRTVSPLLAEPAGRSADARPSESMRRSTRDTGSRKTYSFFPDMGTSPEQDTDVSTRVDDNLKTPSKRNQLKCEGPNEAGKDSGKWPSEDLHLVETATNLNQISTAETDLSKAHGDGKIKKLLKFNPKTGTIGSPPTKRSSTSKEKGSKTKPKTSHMVTISYGGNSALSVEVGVKIDEIFANPPQIKKTTKKKRGPKTAPVPEALTKTDILPAKPVKPVQPTKPLHPLFLGKTAAKPQPDSPQKCIPKTNIVNLTTPKRQSQEQKDLQKHAPAIAFAGFGSFSKSPKVSGSLYPAWPWQGMVHVRGLDDRDGTLDSDITTETYSRKAKYSATQILPREDVLRSFIAKLAVEDIREEVKQVDINEWPSPPRCLRVPVKHLEDGQCIQRRVNAQLHDKIHPQMLEDPQEPDDSQPPDLSLHPYLRQPHSACLKVYQAVRTTLSAFDVGQCETYAWIHKYSPKSASEVLQPGKEAYIFKEWLQSLTVNTVESGKTSTHQKAEPGPRKRKAKKVDDFIVSSGDETDDLDELSEPEADSLLQRDTTRKKTVVRAGRKGTKLKNAVLLSGPHGCGKTATAYAVAKELDFEVFEINSSTKRSGKEIMERVGEMTRNHLVRRRDNVAIALPTEERSGPIDQEAVADDISSGRQASVNSFFNLKAAKTKPKSSQVEAPKEIVSKSGLVAKTISKEQKQSLILIEEIDVLYEEDKQFWSTVLNLIVTSKRPIIMTCNDESFCPADLDCFLHAIIRFNPTPIELATDYMLLVAACEGHVLQRNVVEELYESRNQDLRATMNELNFWCQFAVGDQKHGGDWYYRRQVGQDLNENGRQIRVVSEGSYTSGLGWISEDHMAESLSSFELEEELLYELWDDWKIDVGDWNLSLPLAGWASAAPQSEQRLDALKQYESFTECMSVSDVCSGSTFAIDNQTHFDTTYPPLSAKSVEDFVLGRSPLHSPAEAVYYPVSKHISISLRSRARNILHQDPSTSPLPPHNEDQLKALIRQQIMTKGSNVMLSRRDISIAFDPISYAPTINPFTSSGGSFSLEPSVLDRTLDIIATDVAPYIRGIMTYEARLSQQRAERSGALLTTSTANGKTVKKVRMTRSAMSAIEGGARSTVRREKWFDAPLNGVWVAKTGGGNAWTNAMDEEIGRRRVQAIHALQAALQARESEETPEVGVCIDAEEGRPGVGDGNGT